MSAGTYDDKFILMRQSTQQEPGYGQAKERFSPSGELWGKVEELTSAEKIAFATTQSEVTAKIRIRNYPTLSSKDRLIDKHTDETWEIAGPPIRKDDELVCYAKRGE